MIGQALCALGMHSWARWSEMRYQRGVPNRCLRGCGKERS